MDTKNKIRNIINPQGLPLITFYPGPADDIVYPLKDTGASSYIFVDSIDPCIGSLEYQIKTIKEDIEKAGGNITKTENCNDNIKKIEFIYQDRERKIVYHPYKNVFDFNPCELEEGYDFYFSKGSGPFNNHLYLAKKISLMNLDGFFVSYECDLIHHSIIYDHNKIHIPTEFNLTKLGLEKVSEIKSHHYGQLISIIQKIRQIDFDELVNVLTPTYLELLLKDIASLLSEHEKYKEYSRNKEKGIIPNCSKELYGFFVTNPAWKNHLIKSIKELDSTYDLLSNGTKYKTRIQNSKNRFFQLRIKDN